MFLKVDNLEKTYGKNENKVNVLKGVDFSVDEGEICVILGPSGSGKSTLLNAIGGIDSEISGSIIIDNNEIVNMKNNELQRYRRKYLGFVFQFYNLIPNLNVEENIMLPILLDGKKLKNYRDKLDDILKVVGLEDRRKHTPRELSGGQQQRVAIARALINDPDVILADEPIGNLDSKTGTGVMELLREINLQKGKTIVQVTHSAESAKYGQRIIYVKDGKVVED